MGKTWVVVADSSRARIFRAEGLDGRLVEVEVMAHPEGRLHEASLTTDLPGRAFDSHGQGRHAMEEETPPKRHEAIQFAKRIGGMLEGARNAGNYDALVIVAEPRFLGLLRDNLSRETNKLVELAIDKNLVRQAPEAIRERLPARL
ncbi:MAG: host attachment protein [Thiohalomonadaceae bacterium]